MCLPTGVSITTNAFPRGKARNVAFSMMGLGQPFGFSVGLVLGGAFVQTIGWRSGFYISAGISATLFACGIWALPPDVTTERSATKISRLRNEIDWVGALVISVSFALISYVLG